MSVKRKPIPAKKAESPPAKPAPKTEQRREVDEARAFAKEHGYFATDNPEEIQILIRKGFEAIRVDGAKPYRATRLFVFGLSEKKARELIDG